MKNIFPPLLVSMLALSTYAQTPEASNYAYPTKVENLLHQTGAVITTHRLESGTVEEKVFLTGTNSLTIAVRSEVISKADSKFKEYGLALQMGRKGEWNSRITYVDYDELDGLIAGINKLILLQPELPLVQARYETRGGLVVGAYSTEKREVIGRFQLNNNDPTWIKMSLDTLREFRDLITTAKNNLDLLKAVK